MFLSRKTCVVSVPKWHFFSLARAETGARGKLSYGGEAREKTRGARFLLIFFCESSLLRINQRHHGLRTRLWYTPPAAVKKKPTEESTRDGEIWG